MTRVHLITEDRTGGGLDEVVQKCVQARRQEIGKARLEFSKIKGNVDGAARLLEQCEKYENFRFNYTPRIDHVFYVIDARNVWSLSRLGVDAPKPPLDKSLPLLINEVKKEMAKIGRGQLSEDQWVRIAGGFHPHVLVWERESLMLPVTDRLGLDSPVHDVYDERQAAEAVSERLRRLQKKKYDKATHGPLFLKQIAQDPSLRAVVLTSNPSLRALVNEMVDLD